MTTAAPDPNTEEQPKTVPFEQYQELQRKLDKARKANTQALYEELAALRESHDDTNSKVDALLKYMTMVGETELLSEAQDKVQAVGKELEQRTTAQRAAAAARTQLNKILDQHDAAWSDERLETARQLWASGRHDQAVQETERALRTTEPDLEARIEAILAKHLPKAGTKVDTGDTTGAAPALPRTSAALAEKLASMTPREKAKYLKANLAAIKDMARTGQLS